MKPKRPKTLRAEGAAFRLDLDVAAHASEARVVPAARGLRTALAVGGSTSIVDVDLETRAPSVVGEVPGQVIALVGDDTLSWLATSRGVWQLGDRSIVAIDVSDVVLGRMTASPTHVYVGSGSSTRTAVCDRTTGARTALLTDLRCPDFAVRHGGVTVLGHVGTRRATSTHSDGTTNAEVELPVAGRRFVERAGGLLAIVDVPVDRRAEARCRVVAWDGADTVRSEELANVVDLHGPAEAGRPISIRVAGDLFGGNDEWVSLDTETLAPIGRVPLPRIVLAASWVNDGRLVGVSKEAVRTLTEPSELFVWWRDLG